MEFEDLKTLLAEKEERDGKWQFLFWERDSENVCMEFRRFDYSISYDHPVMATVGCGRRPHAELEGRTLGVLGMMLFGDHYIAGVLSEKVSAVRIEQGKDHYMVSPLSSASVDVKFFVFVGLRKEQATSVVLLGDDDQELESRDALQSGQ